MTLIPKSYTEAFKQPSFLLLIIVTLIGQVASAFLLLALIVSVYVKTGSNFGISGVVLSSAVPGFFLMALAGLLADLYDRRKLMLFSNTFIAIVALAIVAVFGNIYLAISLAFLYFAGNSFYMIAATGASAQLAEKKHLLVSNSIFVFCIVGGQIIGFLLAAIVNFLFGGYVLMIACFALLVAAAVMSFFLPKMLPRKKEGVGVGVTVLEIAKVFRYIFSMKRIWLFFVMLASIQGIIAFGVTLAPGFFNEFFRLSINKSLIIAFPMVCLGAALGAAYVHNPKVREGKFLATGIGALGIPGLALGILITLGLKEPIVLLPLVCIYLICLGFAVIVCMIASRAVLQRIVPHNYLGSVFGANTILASLFAAVLSPFGAGLEALFGYVSILLLAGLVFSFGFFVILYSGNKWNF